MAAVLALAVGILIPPTYTARTLISLKPAAPSWTTSVNGRQPSQSLAFYGALLKGQRIIGRIVDRFGLQQVYREPIRSEALRRLESRTRVGSIDGLLVVEVDDSYPWRAADMANQYVLELRRLLDELRVERAQVNGHRLAEEARMTDIQLTGARDELRTGALSDADLRINRDILFQQQATLREATQAAEVRLAGLLTSFESDHPTVKAQRAAVDTLHRFQQQEHAAQNRHGDGYSENAREVRRLESWQQKLRIQTAAVESDATYRNEVLVVIDRAEIPARPRGPRVLLAVLGVWLVCFIGLLLRAQRRVRHPGFTAAT